VLLKSKDPVTSPILRGNYTLAETEKPVIGSKDCDSWSATPQSPMEPRRRHPQADECLSRGRVGYCNQHCKLPTTYSHRVNICQCQSIRTSQESNKNTRCLAACLGHVSKVEASNDNNILDLCGSATLLPVMPCV
jgi:hypothetical protein